ncbi:MAG: restriction endonuclease subunit S [Acetobacter sp.]|nr:restriction endonuclease subunit S [Acetobacter sp.]
MSKVFELVDRLCPEGVEWKLLGEVCELKRGKVISKEYIKSHQGEYPVYSSQTENNGEFGRISSYMYEGEFLTWTTDGAYAGSVFYRNGKFNITNVCGLLKVKSSAVNIRFLYHFLTIEAPKYVSAGMGNPKLMSNVMQSVKIPLPPLEVQGKIVEILDQFHTLTTSLTEGIPAEIEARRKQYQYYRDKLLSFKEKKET